MIISEQEKNRILGLHSNSRNVNGSLINEQYTWDGPVDITDELISRGHVGMSDDVPRWHGQSDIVKNTWFCLDGRDYRDYGIDEPTFDRFNWLWGGIEGGVTSWGTNEEQVYHALSAAGPDGGDIKSSFAGKGKITKNDLKKLTPVLQCMKTQEPWKNDFTKTNIGVWDWILGDFSGLEKCYLQAYMDEDSKASGYPGEGGGRGIKDCNDQYNYNYHNKLTNWVKELF